MVGFNITDLLSSSVSKVVDSVGTTLDKLITSDEERELIKKELEQIKATALMESENTYLKHEQEITKRWTSDNEHVLTRLVRPAVVIWSFALLTIVMLFDGNTIFGHTLAIKGAYVPILETIVVTVTMAYFGGRTFDKYSKNKHG